MRRKLTPFSSPPSPASETLFQELRHQILETLGQEDELEEEIERLFAISRKNLPELLKSL